MGRTKELKQAPADMPEILPAKVAAIEAAQEANALAVQAKLREQQADLAELAIGVGALQALDLVKSFASAAEIRVFKNIRESKQIKNLLIRTATGEVKTFDSIKEACPALFGRTYQSMLDAEERFDVLGAHAYEAGARLRLNGSALRATRALPPERLEVVRAAISSGSTKADVMSVIEDLAEKAQSAEAATVEARAELKASEEVLANKNKTIDRLQRDLKRIEKLPPDDQLALLKKEATTLATEAEVAVLGGLRQALIALANHGEARGEHRVFMAGLVGQVQAQLDAVREEFNLPDISAAEADAASVDEEALRILEQRNLDAEAQQGRRTKA